MSTQRQARMSKPGLPFPTLDPLVLSGLRLVTDHTDMFAPD